MPAPIKPPQSPVKPHAQASRAPAARRAAKAPNVAKKQQAQWSDSYVLKEHVRPKTPIGISPAQASTPPKPSFAETLLQLDRTLQHSAYYAVTAHPPTQDALP
jgi:hypothetical protein